MNELIEIEKIKPLEVFKPNGLDPILKKIKDKVDAFVPDVTTDKGRKEIASMGAKVSRSKTLIDDAGKSLTEDWRKQTSVVNAERNRSKKFLDDLKAEVRKPLTDYENKESKRVYEIKTRMDKFEGWRGQLSQNGLNSMDVGEAIEEISNVVIDDSWEEFQHQAHTKKKEILAFAEEKHAFLKQSEQQAEENARLKRELDERKEKEIQENAKTEAKERVAAEENDKAAPEQTPAPESMAEVAAPKQQDRGNPSSSTDDHKAQSVAALINLTAMSRDDAEVIVDFIYDGLIPNVKFTGGGEDE